MAAPCSVESPLAQALGPPVNTSGGTSAGLGVGVIKTTFNVILMHKYIVGKDVECG